VTAPTTIDINGFAVREIRIRSGLELAPCAAHVGISRPYLSRIELGQRQTVRPRVYSGLLEALQISDRRTLLALPHRLKGASLMAEHRGRMIPVAVAEGLIQEAVRETLTEHGLMKGTVDVLVSNASSKLAGLLARLDDED
jgi:transcriptional regulator with XRE-family HTH domain